MFCFPKFFVSFAIPFICVFRDVRRIFSMGVFEIGCRHAAPALKKVCPKKVNFPFKWGTGRGTGIPIHDQSWGGSVSPPPPPHRHTCVFSCTHIYLPSEKKTEKDKPIFPNTNWHTSALLFAIKQLFTCQLFICSISSVKFNSKQILMYNL